MKKTTKFHLWTWLLGLITYTAGIVVEDLSNRNAKEVYTLLVCLIMAFLVVFLTNYYIKRNPKDFEEG